MDGPIANRLKYLHIRYQVTKLVFMEKNKIELTTFTTKYDRN